MYYLSLVTEVKVKVKVREGAMMVDLRMLCEVVRFMRYCVDKTDERDLGFNRDRGAGDFSIGW